MLSRNFMSSKSSEATPEDGLDQLINLLSGKNAHLPTAPYPRKYCLTNVRSATTFTIPQNSTGNFTLVVLPASIGDRFGFLYEDMGNGTFTLAEAIQWSIDPDTFYDYGRVVSCVVEVFASTISTTSVALSGMISAAQPDTKLSEITGTGTITEVYGYANLPSVTTDSTKIIIGQNLWQGVCSVFYGLTEMPFTQLFDYPVTSSANKVAYRFDPTQSVGLRTSHTAALIPNTVLTQGSAVSSSSDIVNFDGMILSFSGVGTFTSTITAVQGVPLEYTITCIFRTLSDAYPVTAIVKTDFTIATTNAQVIRSMPIAFTFPDGNPSTQPPFLQPIISYQWSLSIRNRNATAASVTLNNNDFIVSGEFTSYNSKVLGYGTAPQIFTITGALPGTLLSINALQRIEAIPNEDTIKFVETIARPINALFITFYNMVMSSLEYYGIKCFKNRATAAQEDTIMIHNLRIMLDQANENHVVDALSALLKLIKSRKDEDEEAIPEASMRQLFRKGNKLLGKTWSTSKKIATPILKELSKELINKGKTALAEELMAPYAASGRAFALDDVYQPPVVKYSSHVFKHTGCELEVVQDEVNHFAMDREIAHNRRAEKMNQNLVIIAKDDDSKELAYKISECVFFPTVYAKTENGKAVIMKDADGRVTNIFAITPSKGKTLNGNRKYENFRDSTIPMNSDIECHKVNAIDWEENIVYCDVSTPVIAGRSQELAQVVYNMKSRAYPITTHRLAFSGAVNSVGGRDLIDTLPISASILKSGECANKGLTLVANSESKNCYRASNLKDLQSMLCFPAHVDGYHGMGVVDPSTLDWFEIDHDLGKPRLTTAKVRTLAENLVIDYNISCSLLHVDHSSSGEHYAMSKRNRYPYDQANTTGYIYPNNFNKNTRGGRGGKFNRRTRYQDIKVSGVPLLPVPTQLRTTTQRVDPASLALLKKDKREEKEKRRPIRLNIEPSSYFAQCSQVIDSYAYIGPRDYAKMYLKRLPKDRAPSNENTFGVYINAFYGARVELGRCGKLHALFLAACERPNNVTLGGLFLNLVRAIVDEDYSLETCKKFMTSVQTRILSTRELVETLNGKPGTSDAAFFEGLDIDGLVKSFRSPEREIVENDFPIEPLEEK